MHVVFINSADSETAIMLIRSMDTLAWFFETIWINNNEALEKF